VTRDVQLPEPAAELLAVATIVAPSWLTRITRTASSKTDLDHDSFEVELERMVAEESARLVDALEALLGTDVDEQRTNPLSLFRHAVRGPTALLIAHGVPRPPADPFASAHFPDDAYRLGPASWSDVDPTLHDPGLAWGAWKAMTVLRRRRDEGRR
jgi:hypothetical protein